MDASLAPVRRTPLVPEVTAGRAEIASILEGLSRSLLPTAAALAGDASEAQELIEDTLSRVYERLPQLRESQAIGSWARRILVRQFLDRRRLLGRRPTTRLQVVLKVIATQPEEHIDLRNAIGHLPRQDRALVVLHYWMGLTLAECASQLRVPEGTCKSRLHRILRQLRGELE